MTATSSIHLGRWCSLGFLIMGFNLDAVAQKAAPQLECSVSNAKGQRIAGGDFDDKTQRVAMDVTVTNKSMSKPTGPLRADFYVFGESTIARNRFKLLQKESFDFELEPRAKSSHQTEEIVLKFDNTGFARFGEKYKGWIVQVMDQGGEKVFEQKSSEFVTDTKNLPSLSVNDYCDKSLKKVSAP